MRIATYTRISTDEEHQPFSLEAQTVRLDSYIASQDDWEKVSGRQNPNRTPIAAGPVIALDTRSRRGK